MIHAVTRGKVLTAKHFALGMGLDKMTRSIKLIQLVNKLGHCIDYNSVCGILTAQAQRSSELAKSSSILPLTPTNSNSSVKTWFLVDNYDEKVETNCGGDSVNITSLMAFQEEVENAVLQELTLNVPKTRNSAPIAEVETELESLKVDPKKELPMIPKVENATNVDTLQVALKYVIWLLFRKTNDIVQFRGPNDQVLPTCPGWMLKHHQNEVVTMIVEMYLPPINSKVTDVPTPPPPPIFKYLSRLQNLSDDVNMPYVNVILDIGTAMNTSMKIWNTHINLEPVLFTQETFIPWKKTTVS